MKKTAIIIILIASLLVLVACQNKNISTSKSNVSNVTNDISSDSNSTNTNVNKTNSTVQNKNLEIDSPKYSNDNLNTIVDIDEWNHPVKYVFKNANIQVKKVEFKNNKTYPIFYVSLSKNIDTNNKTYYKNLIKQIATANGYWDYEIIDTNKNLDIKVICDKSKKDLKQIIYNKDNSYFAESQEDKNESNSKDKEFIDYITNNVSEVKSFVDSLKNNNNAKGIVYVERYPDKNSTNIYIRDYYGLYVGEEHSDHNVNIYRFAINKDNKQILYYDVVNDKYESLSEWRKSR
ncbi:hypothetical protein [Clostridium sp.]|jgi:hypothetical protein|uniref:hypothetical protein n=1 Tax=Clostridium sp. TaxID=1506 RepID=UPI002590B921|nr:hypothetical protein [Clostridium sp.]MDF2505689.1 hypothetical protein [Clostridium sp.]